MLLRSGVVNVKPSTRLAKCGISEVCQSMGQPAATCEMSTGEHVQAGCMYSFEVDDAAFCCHDTNFSQAEVQLEASLSPFSA